MTFQDLLEVYNGQYIELTGTSAKNQCVDLANAYIKYVLRLPPIEYTNAVDFPSKAGDKYEYILNSPTGVPKEGDLVIWGGTYGHIAIFIEGNANRFISFDENFPTGYPCRVTEHTYLSPKVIGWLHPKSSGVVFPDLQAQLSQSNADRDRNWNWFVAVCDALGVGANVDAAVNEAKKLVDNDDVLVMRDKQIAEANTQISDLQTQFTVKSQELLDAQLQINILTAATEKSQKTVDTLTQQVKDGQEALRTLKDSLNKPPQRGLALIIQGIKDLFLKT